MKRHIPTIRIVLVALLAMATAALAQQTPTQYEPPNRAGIGQVYLARMVGNWTFVDNFYPLRGGKPIVSTGTCKQFMIQGGMFLESDFTFHHANGSKTTGMGISGFSPSTGKFTTVWLDNQRTEMSIRQSPKKFDGKTIVLYAQQLDREHPGRVTFARAYLADHDKILYYNHYYMGPDHKPHMMFQITMTRQ